MSINKSWPRWIIASLCKHFDSRRCELPLIIEGRDVLDLPVNDRLELAINGPIGVNLSPTMWKMSVEIVVLATAIIDTDLYKIHTSVGIAAAGFDGHIPVYKYGKTVYDDDSLLGCLELEGPVVIDHYGKPDPITEILQSSVRGNYYIHLENN